MSRHIIFLRTAIRQYSVICCQALLALLVNQSPVQAVNMTIGKGSGIVWEGMPYFAPFSVPMYTTTSNPKYGLLAISSFAYECTTNNFLTNIAGYQVFPLAPGVGLTPRAKVSATYVRANGKSESLNGTIGLPNTAGQTTGGVQVTSPAGYAFCLSPSMSLTSDFYNSTAKRTVSIDGTWAIVTDGSQTTQEIKLPTMYLSTYSHELKGTIATPVIPPGSILRVSTLSCTVATPTTVNFGSVSRNTTSGTELAVQTNPLTVSCSQDSDKINANINVQFRAISGYFGGNRTRLALTQGGGYITGELPGITSAGTCNGSGGTHFDTTPIKVGNITSSQATTLIDKTIIWRLCSGGARLPTGPVDAATDMLVTFN